MKKQVFSLMMVLALVILAGTSAMAQQTVIGDITAAEGSPGNPKVYLTGSSSTLQITKGNPDSQVDWALYKGTDNSTAATAATDGTGDLDISTTPVNKSNWTVTQTQASGGGEATSSFNFMWSDIAAGNYYLQVTETDPNGCITVRAYHMFILGFDIEVYASNDVGVRTDVADLDACGDGTSYPAFLNNVSLNPAGDGIRGDILNTVDNPAPVGGDLTGVHGTNPRTSRYYTAAITYDVPADGTFTPIAALSATMDITIGGTNVTVADVASINGTSLDDLTGSLVTTTVNSDATNLLFTFEVLFNDRWGVDLEPTAEVLNVKLYSEADAGGSQLGEEPSAYEDVDLSDEGTESPSYENNLSNAWTIYGKPATSIISE